MEKISNLSGGEKTLSSLALVFALHYYKPSPLYVMDEIDAALDFKNVSIVGNYIKERTKNAQFIIISLRANMFELCDNLVGIYKTYDTTKTITINPTVYDKQPVVPSTQTQFDQLMTQQDGIVNNNDNEKSNSKVSVIETNGVTEQMEISGEGLNQERIPNGTENVASNQQDDASEENPDAPGSSSTSQSQGLNDSGESGMATTDSHMEDDESIPETPEQSSLED